MGLIEDDTPAFKDTNKLISYMKKTCKGIRVMYEIKAEDTFIQDVNRWSKKVPELWDEIQAITSYIKKLEKYRKNMIHIF